MTEGSAVDRLFSSLDLSGIEDALRGSGGWGDLRFEQIVEKLISGEYDISQGLGQMVWQFLGRVGDQPKVSDLYPAFDDRLFPFEKFCAGL